MDPYSALATAVGRLRDPLARVLASHDAFVAQNLAAMNSVRSLRPAVDKASGPTR